MSKHSPWVRHKRGAFIICSYERQHCGWAFIIYRWGARDRAGARAMRNAKRGTPWAPFWNILGSGGPCSAGRANPNTLADALAQAEAMLRRVRGRGLA